LFSEADLVQTAHERATRTNKPEQIVPTWSCAHVEPWS